MLRHFAPLTALALAISSPAFGQDADGTPPAAGAAAQQEVVGLVSAIEVAQGRVDGGVLEAELETEDGNLVYEIDLVRGDDVYEVVVNAQTGDVVSTREQRLTGIWSGWFEQDELEAARTARATLAEALTAAEQQIGGRIKEASLDKENGRWLYEIEVQTAQGEREMTIDAATGQVVATDD